MVVLPDGYTGSLLCFSLLFHHLEDLLILLPFFPSSTWLISIFIEQSFSEKEGISEKLACKAINLSYTRSLADCIAEYAAVLTQKPLLVKNAACSSHFHSQRCALERHVSSSGPLPQYGFGQDLQWYATDAIVGHKLNFRRHPPLEQARLPGLSSQFLYFLLFPFGVAPNPVDNLSTSVVRTGKRRLCILRTAT